MELPKGRHRPRVGRLPYLLSVPFTGSWASDHFELITAPPRQLAHLTRQDELDAACVPITDVRSLGRRFEPLGNLGLAAVGAPPFAMFASRIEPDLLGRAAIGVSDQAATAATALELVLEGSFKVERPNIVSLPPDRYTLGAYMLVGDDAIDLVDEARRPFVCHYNLADEWRKWSGLPLVLGRWVVRKTMPDKTKELLEASIRQSVADTLRAPGPIVASHLDEHQLSCTIEKSVGWLSECRYELGSTEEKAISHLITLHKEKNRAITSWRDLM